MVSVTPDITASTSFQAPPPRAKADPSPGNDSFASLVDGNATAAADNNDRAQDRGQDRIQDRAQDASPAPQSASDQRPPARRDDAAAADKAQSRDANAGKSERDDTDDRDLAVTDGAGTPAPAVVTANTSTASKPVAPEVTADAQAAARATSGSAEAAPSGDAATAQTIVPTVPAARPAAPKTAAAAKTSTTVGEDASSSGESDVSTASSTETPVANTTAAAVTSGTEQPAIAKPNAAKAHAEVAKPEAAGTQAPAATAAHLNPASPEAAPSQSNAQSNPAQIGAVPQPQLQATATQAQPSFTVTAAPQSAAVPLSGLAMEIAASVRAGKSRFEIRLDPAELGRIDVRIDVDRNGKVTSHLTVERPETLSPLRQDAPQLQRALNDAGLSTGDSGLQFSLRDQSSQGQNGNQSNNPNAQRLILTEEDTVPAAVAGSYGRMLSASGGVDIRV